MRHRLVLKGGSRAFTGVFKKTLEDCGFDPAVESPDGPPLRTEGISIYEIRKKKDLCALPEGPPPGPYIIFSDIELGAEIPALKEKGLIGVVTRGSAPEYISFTVNQALFYNKMLKRNPRAAVNIPVGLKTGARTMKSFASALSRDGMFIVTLNPLPADSACHVSFSVPGIKKQFETKARVIYNIPINKELNIISSPGDPFKRLVAHPGMAVFFVDLHEDERALIDEYIKKVN